VGVCLTGSVTSEGLALTTWSEASRLQIAEMGDTLERMKQLLERLQPTDEGTDAH
jgi:hypothetical protein